MSKGARRKLVAKCILNPSLEAAIQQKVPPADPQEFYNQWCENIAIPHFKLQEAGLADEAAELEPFWDRVRHARDSTDN